MTLSDSNFIELQLPGVFMRLVYTLGQRLVWIFTYVATRLFTNFKIENRQHLRNLPKPLLIIANHRSYWDPMIIGTLFPLFSFEYLPLGFMADDSLYERKLFRIFFKLTGTYPARRGQGYDISLAYPRYLLSRNRAFLLFPFGKILLDDSSDVQPQRGIAMLAKEFTGLTILPIYLHTTPNLNMFRFLFKRVDMKVIVGEPFMIDPGMRSQSPENLAYRLAEQIVRLGKAHDKAR